eukprot:6123027-Alexandrium_andersonii.AAC.1
MLSCSKRRCTCGGASKPQRLPTRSWASLSAADTATNGAVVCWVQPWALQVAHGAAYHSPAAETASSPPPAPAPGAASARTNSGYVAGRPSARSQRR